MKEKKRETVENLLKESLNEYLKIQYQNIIGFNLDKIKTKEALLKSNFERDVFSFRIKLKIYFFFKMTSFFIYPEDKATDNEIFYNIKNFDSFLKNINRPDNENRKFNIKLGLSESRKYFKKAYIFRQILDIDPKDTNLLRDKDNLVNKIFNENIQIEKLSSMMMIDDKYGFLEMFLLMQKINLKYLNQICYEIYNELFSNNAIYLSFANKNDIPSFDYVRIKEFFETNKVFFDEDIFNKQNKNDLERYKDFVKILKIYFFYLIKSSSGANDKNTKIRNDNEVKVIEIFNQYYNIENSSTKEQISKFIKKDFDFIDELSLKSMFLYDYAAPESNNNDKKTLKNRNDKKTLKNRNIKDENIIFANEKENKLQDNIGEIGELIKDFRHQKKPINNNKSKMSEWFKLEHKLLKFKESHDQTKKILINEETISNAVESIKKIENWEEFYNYWFSSNYIEIKNIGKNNQDKTREQLFKEKNINENWDKTWMSNSELNKFNYIDKYLIKLKLQSLDDQDKFKITLLILVFEKYRGYYKSLNKRRVSKLKKEKEINNEENELVYKYDQWIKKPSENADKIPENIPLEENLMELFKTNNKNEVVFLLKKEYEGKINESYKFKNVNPNPNFWLNDKSRNKKLIDKKIKEVKEKFNIDKEIIEKIKEHELFKIVANKDNNYLEQLRIYDEIYSYNNRESQRNNNSNLITVSKSNNNQYLYLKVLKFEDHLSILVDKLNKFKGKIASIELSNDAKIKRIQKIIIKYKKILKIQIVSSIIFNNYKKEDGSSFQIQLLKELEENAEDHKYLEGDLELTDDQENKNNPQKLIDNFINDLKNLKKKKLKNEEILGNKYYFLVLKVERRNQEEKWIISDDFYFYGSPQHKKEEQRHNKRLSFIKEKLDELEKNIQKKLSKDILNIENILSLPDNKITNITKHDGEFSYKIDFNRQKKQSQIQRIAWNRKEEKSHIQVRTLENQEWGKLKSFIKKNKIAKQIINDKFSFIENSNKFFGLEWGNNDDKKLLRKFEVILFNYLRLKVNMLSKLLDNKNKLEEKVEIAEKNNHIKNDELEISKLGKNEDKITERFKRLNEVLKRKARINKINYLFTDFDLKELPYIKDLLKNKSTFLSELINLNDEQKKKLCEIMDFEYKE